VGLYVIYAIGKGRGDPNCETFTVQSYKRKKVAPVRNLASQQENIRRSEEIHTLKIDLLLKYFRRDPRIF